MVTIRDTRWLTKFLYEFCHRAVHGAFNRRAIEQRHIEIHAVAGGVRIHICDSQGPLIQLVYDGRDAFAQRYMNIDAAVGRADRHALTACVQTLLRKHGFIDCKGHVIRRGVA